MLESDTADTVNGAGGGTEGMDPSTSDDNSSLSDEYTETMQKRMGSVSLVYRHEDGMNFTRILDDLIVGSCPQIPSDIQRLASEEGVRTILSLQENSDMDYFSLDLGPILEACKGRIDHVRRPVRDFDAHSLRLGLPDAVKKLHASVVKQGGTAYIHCTAGLGRAPATALAYMWWMRGIPLPEAHVLLTGLRPCSPKLLAIRAATLDLLQGSKTRSCPLTVLAPATCRKVEVAGLDVGWGNRLALKKRGLRWETLRELPPGAYPYKFVVDGRWTTSKKHPTVDDGNSLNNALLVEGWETTDEEREVSARIMDAEGDLTREEAAKIRALLRA